MTENEKKEMHTAKIVKTVITAAVLIFAAATMFLGRISVEFGGDAFTVSGGTFAGSATIGYSEITDVQLDDSLTIGSRTFGIGSARLQAGRYKNAEFGDYRLYSYSDCHTYVVVHTADGVLAFNASTPEATKTLYEELTARRAAA